MFDMNAAIELTEKDIVKRDNVGGIEHQQNTAAWIIHYWGNKLSTSNDRLLTANKIEGKQPLTLTKRASCIGYNRSLIQNSEFATQGQW